MHVTLVSPFDPHPDQSESQRAHVGGVERVFAEVSRRLVRRGHDVTVVCSSPRRMGATREDGIEWVRAKRRMTVMRAPVAGLAKHVPQHTDVVHVAATYPFTTPPVLRRAKELKHPSVLDFHFEPDPGSWIGRMGAMVYRQVGPRAYAQADAVLVRSRAYAESAPSLAHVPSDRWHVVPNGVDTERFTPEGRAPQAEYLLFVGRLVPYKGLDVLLQALKQHPPGIPLLVAGDGPMRAKWEALAKRLEVQAHFAGAVSEDVLPALYRGARLTILPSVTRQEAFGLALVESMASGTPVVASDLPGVAEVARTGGLTARIGDADHLGRQILAALADKKLPRGRRLAEIARSKYSWDAVTHRIIGVYESLQGNGAEGPGTDVAEVETGADPRRDAVLPA